VPSIDVVDSSWLAASPSTVAALVAEPANWRRWWPGLELVVDEWRNEKGVRWTVASVGAGRGARLSGSAEVWLEPMFEGVVAHFFLRLDAAPGRRLRRTEAERVARRYRLRTKEVFWALADHLDPGRLSRHTSASHASVT
jgi:hypothetical protein